MPLRAARGGVCCVLLPTGGAHYGSAASPASRGRPRFFAPTYPNPTAPRSKRRRSRQPARVSRPRTRRPKRQSCSAGRGMSVPFWASAARAGMRRLPSRPESEWTPLLSRATCTISMKPCQFVPQRHEIFAEPGPCCRVSRARRFDEGAEVRTFFLLSQLFPHPHQRSFRHGKDKTKKQPPPQELGRRGPNHRGTLALPPQPASQRRWGDALLERHVGFLAPCPPLYGGITEGGLRPRDLPGQAWE